MFIDIPKSHVKFSVRHGSKCKNRITRKCLLRHSEVCFSNNIKCVWTLFVMQGLVRLSFPDFSFPSYIQHAHLHVLPSCFKRTLNTKNKTNQNKKHTRSGLPGNISGAVLHIYQYNMSVKLNKSFLFCPTKT